MHQCRTFTSTNIKRHVLTNAKATQLIQNLSASCSQKHIASKSLAIYQQIDGEKNHQSINALLRVLSQSEPRKVLLVWRDIKQEEIKGISIPALLKCCMNALKRDKFNPLQLMREYMEILKHIESSNLNSLNIGQKTSLIHAYGHCLQFDHALKIFNAIPLHKRDAIAIGAMMKCCVMNQKYQEAIELYTKCNQDNDILHNMMLKACILSRQTNIGLGIIDQHIDVHSKRHSAELLNTLINFYGEMKDIKSALHAFESIPMNKQDAASVGTMMKCYINSNQNNKAIELYRSYSDLHDDVCHNLAIKAFMNMGDYQSVAREIIPIISKSSKRSSIELQNTLIDYYGQSGDMNNALLVFRNICDGQKPSIVTIGAMMKSYIANQQAERALDLYHQLADYALKDQNDVCCILAIKACVELNDFQRARNLLNWPEFDTKKHTLGLLNTLIDFYGHFGKINEAASIFNQIRDANKVDAVTIGAMMKCLINNQDSHQAVQLYRKYATLHNDIIHTLAIKACVNTGDMATGLQLIKDNGIDKKYGEISTEFQNALIHFFGHFKDIRSAQHVFGQIMDKKPSNLYCMLHALCNNTLHDEALRLYEQFAKHDDVSHIYAIKACIDLNRLDHGKQIVERHIHYKGDNPYSIELLNVLIELYGKSGDVQHANDVFETIPHRKKNAFTVNNMMKCYIQNGKPRQALELYNNYKELHNDVLHSLAIKTCMNANDFNNGRTLIEKHVSYRTQSHSVGLMNTLIDFYGQCGEIQTAWNVFNAINNKDPISINSMMTCCMQNGDSAAAIALYKDNETLLDDISHLLLIKACMNINDVDTAHAVIVKHIDLQTHKHYDVNLLNTLVDFYGQCRHIKQAQYVFDRITDNKKDIVSIGAMMNAYYINDLADEALALFNEIMDGKLSGFIRPNRIAYAIALKSCTETTSLHLGKRIHEDMKNSVNGEALLNDLEIQICLISMYGKCGKLESCQEIFDAIKQREYDKYCSELSLWNALMNAYARNGRGEQSIQLFYEMSEHTRLVPNNRTYCIVLNGCSHSGDVQQAKHIWSNIEDEHVKYSTDVSTAYIDCLSRKGLIKEAYHTLKTVETKSMDKSTMSDFELPWMSLLSAACNKHKDREMAQTIYLDIEERFRDNAKFMRSAVVTMTAMFSDLKNMPHAH